MLSAAPLAPAARSERPLPSRAFCSEYLFLASESASLICAGVTVTVSFSRLPSSPTTGLPSASRTDLLRRTSRSASRGTSLQCSPRNLEGFTKRGLNS